MRIGIEVTHLFNGLKTGLYFHTLHLVRGLARLQSSSQLTLFTATMPAAQQFAETTALCSPLPVRHFRSPGRPYRLRLALDPISRQHALFYMGGHLAPPSSARANVFLVPDLSPLHDPHWHTDVHRRHWLEHYELIQQHADAVVTYSEHTRSEVAEHLGVPREKIHAIPLAPAANFRPLDDREQLRQELSGLGLEPGKYILTVGTLEPRKNHVRLLRAFHRLVRSGAAGEQRLVLAGPQGWRFDAIFREIEQLGLAERVQHVGQYPRLEVLMNGATAMAYPSLFEGFGLPPLEAMACGTPVITSNASSLPEVVGQAGLQVDPLDEDALAAAMARVIADEGLRAEMRRAGLARAQQFSWDRTAGRTLRVLEDSIQQRQTPVRIRFGSRLTAAILHSR